MSIRTSPAEHHVLAVEALAAALAAAGLETRPATPDQPGDLVADVGGRTVFIDVKSLVAPHPDAARRLVDQGPAPGTLPVVVADAVYAPVRDILVEAGWGWLDRRGHLQVRAPGLLIRTDRPPMLRPGRGYVSVPIAGRSGISLALALLMRPHQPPGVREIARQAELSPSAISQARQRLRDAALVDREGRPLVPELFWALADVWRPAVQRTAVASLPGSDAADLLELGFSHLDGPGWAASGGYAAIAWGAPLVESSPQVVDFYIPSAVVLRRAEKVLGPGPPQRARLAVAPSRLVVVDRREGGLGQVEWPVVHPVVAALDLALDPSRGHEALEAWDPPEGFTRVW